MDSIISALSGLVTDFDIIVVDKEEAESQKNLEFSFQSVILLHFASHIALLYLR